MSTPPHPMTWVAEDGVAHLIVQATEHGTVNSITSLPASYVAGKFVPCKGWIALQCGAHLMQVDNTSDDTPRDLAHKLQCQHQDRSG